MKEHQETINLSAEELARFLALLKTSSRSTLVFAVTWLQIALLATAEDGLNSEGSAKK